MNFDIGSPPHTRGQDGHAVISVLDAMDHPRTRGDKFYRRLGFLCTVGSPPHTRGQVLDFSPFRIDLRITPAHAGTSDRTCARRQRVEDHPRTRGDKRSGFGMP